VIVRKWLQQVWRHRTWPLCAGALLLTCITFMAGDDLLVRGAGYLVALWWLALLFVLPFRIAAALLIASGGLAYTFDYASRTKVELTQLPLMAFDLRIVAVYPDALLEAIDVTGLQRAGLYGAVVITMMAVAFVVAWQLRSSRRRFATAPRDIVRSASVAVLAVLFIGAQLAVFMNRLPDIVDRSSFVRNIWSPEVLVNVERRLGTVPFLFYSHELERRSRGNLVFIRDAGHEVDVTRLEAAATRLLSLPAVTVDSAPNIVLVKLESTFDLNEAFHLAAPVRSILYDRDSALAYGLLRVNAVGGGSWISEYEAVTGVDSRLFGFTGFYTHAALSPLMRGSLATWLGDRGYRTAAFYPVEGSFLNVRRAFPRYGFDSFYASEDLGLDAWAAPDSTIMSTYLQQFRDDDSPFFLFLVLNENHGPHRCLHFKRSEDLVARFSGDAAFEVNCRLNEFVRSLRSSEHAVRSVMDRLQRIQERSGRPWLLVTFGDHQPHSFTGTGGYADDYSSFRRKADQQETLYRFAGTVPNRFRLQPGSIPVTLLPTLISAFVAAGPGDLYLGANLLLFEACGIDAIGGTFSYATGGTLLDSVRPGTDTECSAALSAALASYRKAGIFQFLDDADGA
jgi:phosphoglycerol transferase MdoB-like AlkP superfamily enzyme